MMVNTAALSIGAIFFATISGEAYPWTGGKFPALMGSASVLAPGVS